MLQLNDSIELVNGIGEKYKKKLINLGINTIGDFLYYLPHRYDDFSDFKKINELNIGETVTIQGRIISIKTTQARYRRLIITEVYLEDDTGSIKATWFNAPVPLRYLKKNQYLQISGKIGIDKKGEAFFSHPNFEFISKTQIKSDTENIIQPNKTASTGIMVPIYHETTGLNSFWFRRIIKKILPQAIINDFIPGDILKSQNLIDLSTAFHYIHFPQSEKEIALAKKRFAFEKIFLLQLKTLLTKKDWDKQKSPKIPFYEQFIKNFVKSLPFTLTSAQKKCAWQIIQDLNKDKPMNRLLEGDVGSGKTVVAVIAILSVINQLYQVAFLAPTEVLAVQHYRGLKKFFKFFDFTIAILTKSEIQITTGNNSDQKISRPKLLKKLANGEIDLIIGTHAIIQKTVKFKNLGLVIIDEQHRFGVRQRAYLQQEVLSTKKQEVVPHLLSMTATPIPRTLSLSIFGNLDLSIIDEFPAGRKKIITKIIHPRGREQVYQFIHQSIKTGRQVFIIFPLVKESSKISEVKAATEEHQRLQEKIFPQFKLGLLHGKMKPKEKNDIMNDFKNKKIDILVSTSVVEVGVDIPNANIMLIEGAERFGLAQLHQFRGRVGRGEYQSYCFLFTSDNVANTTARLKVLEKTNNGFKISEEDLKLRGPGQFMGTAQSGLPDIAMESLTDVKIIEKARKEAQRLIAFDSHLKHFSLLKEELTKLNTVTHWE